MKSTTYESFILFRDVKLEYEKEEEGEGRKKRKERERKARAKLRGKKERKEKNPTRQNQNKIYFQNIWRGGSSAPKAAGFYTSAPLGAACAKKNQEKMR